MRKSFHTLSGIITDAMGQDPCNGNVYIFINRDRIKLLHWEPGGMVQYSKLLEAGTLGKSDSASDNEVCANIEWRELVMIVEYLDEYRKSTGSAENMRSQIQDYIADAARAKLAEDKAKAENEVLRREAAALREQLAKERRRESRREERAEQAAAEQAAADEKQG